MNLHDKGEDERQWTKESGSTFKFNPQDSGRSQSMCIPLHVGRHASDRAGSMRSSWSVWQSNVLGRVAEISRVCTSVCALCASGHAVLSLCAQRERQRRDDLELLCSRADLRNNDKVLVEGDHLLVAINPDYRSSRLSSHLLRESYVEVKLALCQLTARALAPRKDSVAPTLGRNSSMHGGWGLSQRAL
jgi:hypothetical protein